MLTKDAGYETTVLEGPDDEEEETKGTSSEETGNGEAEEATDGEETQASEEEAGNEE